ncbi:MAG: phytanoyl-CoA dioxygenase family protein [Armatimonadetes bacterium]|nr:phytanoyl-CoA dioxygenase family protein [Armatimonadota bacterium]MDW8122506.1 phytanoyl-CoA dioxygenase family protein [Armatimonadota bacterium]
MRTEVTQEEIEFYRENGFVIIRDFLTPEELEEWREAVMEAVEERGSRRFPWLDKDSEGYYARVFKQRVNLWQTNDRVKKLMLDPRLGKMAADLAGVDGIRIWHDQALIKEPWANPTSWHLDLPYWSFDSRDAISIWVALDDATLENGCLFFLPGTHKTARLDNVGIGPNMADLFEIYPEWKNIEPVAAPMKAGSCSFHNGLVAHAANANMTPRYRRAMTCGYMPDGCRFNGKPNILTPEQLARLKVGDLLNDESQNPLIYSRSWERKE